MTLPRWGGLGLVALVAGAGCHRAPTAAATDAEGAADDAGAQPHAAPSLVGPSRCRATAWGAQFADDGGASEIDLGDAVPFSGEVALAFVHRVSGERVAAVALLRPDVDAAPHVVDLGPTLGDAPPPRIVARPTELVAAFHAVPSAVRAALGAAGNRAGAGRPLVVRSVTADGSTALFSIDEGRDDSLASDFALGGDAGDHGLVVWDEATGEPRGVVRGAPFVMRQKPSAPVDLSPKESDAEMPRVVPFGKGFAVVWIARAPDPQSPAPDGSDLEVPGEPRSLGWLEMVPVDDRGVATGPLRRLTSQLGHVTAFDLSVSPAGSALAGSAASAHGGPLLYVVARDDGEAVDGSGGSVLRVRVGLDAAEPPIALATDGLGRGAPGFVEGPATWLSWVGANEQLRMLALDAAGNPAGLASAEDGMDEAQPVLALPSGHVLVETPADAARQLRTFVCDP
jgi:hypothetical protein